MSASTDAPRTPPARACPLCDRELPRGDLHADCRERLELDPEESDALAQVDTDVLELLASGRGLSLIGAVARARRGAVMS